MTDDRFTNIDDYLDVVCREVRCREVHPDIRVELETHFEELVEELSAAHSAENVVHRKNGPPLDVVREALRYLGNPEDIGKRLNQIHSNKVDWVLVGLLLFMAALGMATQMSILMSQTQLPGQAGYLWGTELVGTVLGIGAFFWDYRKCLKMARPIFFVTFAVMLFTAFAGPGVNGVKNLPFWPQSLNLFGMSPFLLTLALAGMMTKLDWNRKSSLLKVAAYLFLPIWLYYTAHANADGTEYVIGFFAVLAASRPGLKRFLLMVGVLVVVLAVTAERLASQFWFWGRWTAFLAPQKTYATFGYWYVQARRQVTSAHFFGHGFAASYPPMSGSGSTLTLSYLLYAFGWGGAILAFVLIAGILYRMWRTLRLTRHRYSSVLTVGIVALFAYKFLYSIAMGFGVIPILSIHMPFVSPAPDEFAVEMVVTGILMSVYRMRNRISTLPASSDDSFARD